MMQETKFMPVSVHKSGGGDLLLVQEWPSLEFGERFMRVMVEMDDAEKLAMNILSVLREARRK